MAARGTRIAARGINPLNQTRGNGKIEPRATNLTTRKKGSTPAGIRIGVKKRGGR